MAAFGINAIQPEDNPHILGFATARTGNTDAFLEIYNGPTSSDRAFTFGEVGIIIENAYGLVVGHSAQLVTADPSSPGTAITAEVQVAGTATADATLMITRHSADANAGGITLSKSRNAALASYTVVQDNDYLGHLAFAADDGTDTDTTVARISGRVDDASPAASDIGGELIFETASGTSANDLSAALTLAADKLATFVGIISVTDATEATSTTAASLKTAGGIAWVKDAYVGDDMFFTSGAVLNFDAGNVTFTHAANKMTLGGGDFHVANGQGVVIGHTAQLTIGGNAAELQVLGTADADSTVVLGRWSADAQSPSLKFYKSRHATIGSFDDVVSGDDLGSIHAYGDDGTDDDTVSSAIVFDTEGTISTGQVPGVIKFQVAAAGTLANALVIDSAKKVALNGATSSLPLNIESTLTDTIDSTTAGAIMFEGNDDTQYWKMRLSSTGNLLVFDYNSGGTFFNALGMNRTGGVLINETTNANMTIGLTINQGNNSDQILGFKNSVGSFSTGLTTAVSGTDVEVDDFFKAEKGNPDLGGVLLSAMAEDGALGNVFTIASYGGTANTTKTTAARGLVEIQTAEHNGSNTLADITANGNVFAIIARVGGSSLARFVVDEDGDIFSVSVTDVTGSGNALTATAFDREDDAQLVRAFALATANPKDIVRTEHDEFLRYNEADLVRLGILGAPIADGGMWNINQNLRLVNGAVWQHEVAIKETRSRQEQVEDCLRFLVEQNPSFTGREEALALLAA